MQAHPAHQPRTSDEAVRRATARSRTEWFALLDAWGAADATRVVVGFTSKGPARSQVALEHERLPDARAAERTRAYWRERLTALKQLLED